MNTKTYLHNCNAGDLIGALAGLREIYHKTGKKAIIYQQLDIPGHYMQGIVHSVKDANGIQVTMNQAMFYMLRPLLLAQPYIYDFKIHQNEQVEVDLTIIREKVMEEDGISKIIAAKQFVNIPNMALPGWLMTIYPQMACDLADPWIAAPYLSKEEELWGRIIVNRTERYRAPKMDYSFLKPYEQELLFVGTEQEHRAFSKEFNLEFPRLEVEDFLELASALRTCRFFLGNQSFAWNLANAMGVPRILEMFPQAPNCQPFVGQNSYGSYFSLPIHYHFLELHKKTAVL